MPIGNESFAVVGSLAVLALPAGLADVQPAEIVFLVEQQGVIHLLVEEGLFARLAMVRARLNVPFVH